MSNAGLRAINYRPFHQRDDPDAFREFLVPEGGFRDRYAAGYDHGQECVEGEVSPFRGGTPEHAGWWDAAHGFENRHPILEEGAA